MAKHLLEKCRLFLAFLHAIITDINVEINIEGLAQNEPSINELNGDSYIML